MIKSILNFIKQNILIADQAAKSKSVDLIESEIIQLETIFANLVFGYFIGIPSAPIQISFDLLSVGNEPVEFLINRMIIQNDPLAELASVFRID